MSAITRLDTRELDNVVNMVEREKDELVGTVAFSVERDAKINAPYITGYLYNSIEAARVKFAVWRANVYADYGKYVELGTSKMRAQPYLFPAVERAYRVYVEAWKRLFR